MRELLSYEAIIDRDASMRTIPKDRIIDLLLLGGFAFETGPQAEHRATELVIEAIDRWLLAGLSSNRAASHQELFDPAEVVNFMKWSSLYRGDEFWENHFVFTGQRLYDSINLSKNHQQFFSRSQFNFQRTFHLIGAKPAKQLRLRLPLPQNRTLYSHLKVHFPEGVKMASSTKGHQERLEFLYSNTVSVSVSAQYQWQFDWPLDKIDDTQNLSDQERILYLDSRAGFVYVNDRIKKFAHDIVGPQKAIDAADAIWDWMMDSFFLGVIHYHQIEKANLLEGLIKRRLIDCQLGSALMASLCRALDIPARVVGGYLLYPLAPTQHYWVEVWIDGFGWRSYDFMAWDLAGGGRQKKWRNIFKGAVDPRIITEIFPRKIIGSVGLSLSGQIHRLMRSHGNGIVIEYLDAKSGSVIYQDMIDISAGDSDIESFSF